MEFGASAWSFLGAAGGGLALVFIVALAAGILALTLFYLGSAVVVLERFARVARRGWSIAVCGLVMSGLGGAVLLEWTRSERGPASWMDQVQWWLGASIQVGVGVAIAMAVAAVLVRRVRPERLAAGVVGVAGLGAGALLSSGGAMPVGVAMGTSAALWGALTVRNRRRMEHAPPGRATGLVGALFLALAVSGGIGLAFSGGSPNPVVGELGFQWLAALLGAVAVGLVPLAAAGFLDLRRTVEWFIAVRYLVARRRQVFISAITAICVVGVAAGVWLIIVVLSVLNGFQQTWRDEILGNRAHFSVHEISGPFGHYAEALEQVRATPGVVGASPYLEAEGMVRSDEGGIFSVRVRGIDPESVVGVSDLEDDMILGSLADLAEDADSSAPGILMGSQLAVSLGVGVGDPLLLISPFGGPSTPLGPAPRLARFTVVGIFQSTFFQHDEVYTYVHLPAAQEFKRSGDVIDGIDARTTDFYRSRVVAADAVERVGDGYYTRDWKDYFPAFFQALKTERVMMFLLLTMIMIVAAFVIVTTLIMMIMEKSSDIAILKAMGAEDATIERVFAVEGTLIGLAGTVIGVLAGVAVTDQLPWIQDWIEALTGIDTLPASVYQLSTLPTQVDPLQVALVVGIAMILSLGATWLPSRQGARLDPAEALRYE